MASLKRTSSDDQVGPYYRIDVDLTYRVFDGTLVVGSGAGRARSMSSDRVLLDADTWLPRSALVELSLSWPVMLDQRIPLKLVVLGRTLALDGCIAVDILRHEFRTHGQHGESRYPTGKTASGRRTLTASA